MEKYRLSDLSHTVDGDEVEADLVAEVVEVVGVVSEVDDLAVAEPVASGKLEIPKVNTLPSPNSAPGL